MKTGMVVLTVVATMWAQGSTIDLGAYKGSDAYAYAEVSHTIGEHEYRFVNIKPKSAGDTTCIAAVVIDKRKYVLMDLEMDGQRTGLVVPENQPVKNGLLVVKVSPLDAKTFLVLESGKVVTLPGDRVIVDPMGKTILCIWDNSGSFQLTVLDYRKMRLVVSTTPIVEPQSWETNGLAYYFTAAGEEGGQYTIDLFSKQVSKVQPVEKGLEKLEYTFEPSGLDAKSCCGSTTLR